jgi:threonine synthase
LTVRFCGGPGTSCEDHRSYKECRHYGAEDLIAPAARALASRSGVDVCPEGGAAWAAYQELHARGEVSDTDCVIIFNTGTGLKYRG